MTNVPQESGGAQGPERQPSAATSAEIFGELVMHAEFRLIAATENSKQPPVLGWVKREIDPFTGKPIGWYRIGNSQRIIDPNLDLLEIGLPIKDDERPLTEETIEESLVGISDSNGQNEHYILVRDPRDEDGPTYRITEANAQELVAEEIDEANFVAGLLTKLSSEHYHVHPILVRIPPAAGLQSSEQATE